MLVEVPKLWSNYITAVFFVAIVAMPVVDIELHIAVKAVTV
jgi:hypothetical protein